MHSKKKSFDRIGGRTLTLESMGAGSDLPGEVITHPPCGPCHKKADKKILQASWYCQQCKDVICDECKSLHKIFKQTESHTVVSLYPACGHCQKKEQNVDADFFCYNCKDYLCDECKSKHKKAIANKHHTIVRSQEHIMYQPLTYQTTTHTEAQKAFNTKQPSNSKQVQQRVTFSKPNTMFVTNFDIQIPGDGKLPCISGSAFLPDSRLLLVDYSNNKLKMFDVNFKLVTSRQFKEYPWKVSVYDSSNVLLTAGHEVLKLSVDRSIREWGRLSLQHNCFGVAHINKGRLALTSTYKGDDMLCVYSTVGNQLSRLSLGQKGRIPYHVTVDRERSRAYVSTGATHTVSAVDLVTNKIIFTYKHKDLSWPRGVAVDHDNNLYICGGESNNVHQVSSEGQCIQIILTKDDGMDQLQTISFAPESNSFILGSSHKRVGNTVNVYKMQ